MVSPSWLKNLKQLDLGEGAAGQHQQKPRQLAGSERVRSSPSQEDAGFTLLELLVVVLMVGILGAIAVPSWLSFVAKERVSKVQNVVTKKIQQAQLEATTKKRSYSVSFNVHEHPTKKTIKRLVAIYPTPAKYKEFPPDDTDDGEDPSDVWKRLTDGLGMEDVQVLFCTNIDPANPNKALSTATCKLEDLKDKPRTIIFDHTGTISPDTDPDFSEDKPLSITVANPVDSAKGEGNLKRCVKVMTLLGAMRTESDGECK